MVKIQVVMWTCGLFYACRHYHSLLALSMAMVSTLKFIAFHPSQFWASALRLVDNKAILYFDAPSSSDALNWFRGRLILVTGMEDCTEFSFCSNKSSHPCVQNVDFSTPHNCPLSSSLILLKVALSPHSHRLHHHSSLIRLVYISQFTIHSFCISYQRCWHHTSLYSILYWLCRGMLLHSDSIL
jgi:hypothetical protein